MVLNVHCQRAGKLSSEITQGSGSIYRFFFMISLPQSVCLLNLQGVPSWERLQTGLSIHLHLKWPCPTRKIFCKKQRAASVKSKSQKQRSSEEAPRKTVVMRRFFSSSNALLAKQIGKVMCTWCWSARRVINSKTVISCCTLLQKRTDFYLRSSKYSLQVLTDPCTWKIL